MSTVSFNLWPPKYTYMQVFVSGGAELGEAMNMSTRDSYPQA